MNPNSPFRIGFLTVSCLFLTLPVCATQREVACSGSITSALQSAINSSVDGDIVNIGAGSCTAGGVSWSNKNIVVQGQGIGVTTVSGLSFTVSNTTKSSFRITGMSVGAPAQWRVDAGNRETGIKGWRIDHIAFSYPSCGQNIAIWIQGINWGLIDNSTFNNAGNAIFISGYAEGTDEVNPWPADGTPGMGGFSWLLPLNLGTDDALYIEDNSFTLANGCYYGVGDSYYGGRSVFRHNTVSNAYWQNHAARGAERGGNLKAEIYNNDFNATDPAWYRAIHMRSGTGVIFNNSLRGAFTTMQVDNQRSDGQSTGTPFGACDGSSSWDGNTPGQAGWPCLDQIGRGPGPFPNQPSVPLYIWNNGSAIGCSTGGSCANNITMVGDGDAHVQAGRDFINNGTTPKPGYTPYTYPHPLRSGTTPPSPVDTQAPTAPTGVATANMTSSGLRVNWTASTDNVAVTGYRLDVSLNSGFSSFVSGFSNLDVGNVTTYVLSGLSAGTQYYVRLRAQDAANNTSGNSSTASATTGSIADTQAPTVPSNVTTANPTSNAFRVNWTASTDNVAVTRYRLDVSLNSAFSSFVTGFNNLDIGNVTTYLVSGLSASTQYYVRVRAQDAVPNTSGNSSTASATTTATADTQAPTVPSNIVFSNVGSDRFTVEWNASTDNVAVSGYRIDIALNSSFSQLVVNNQDLNNSRAYAAINVDPVTTYYVRVRAYDTSNNLSSYAVTRSTTTGAALSTPPPTTPDPPVTPPTPPDRSPGSLDSVKVFPNPWRGDRHTASITFNGLPTGATVKIFTISGHLVRDLGENGGQILWDRRNSSDDTVASGTYVYLITDPRGGQRKGKLAVIK